MDNKELEKQQVESFIKMIKDIVRQTLETERLNVEYFYDGNIYGTNNVENNGVGSVKVFGSGVNEIIYLENIPNKTGASIESGAKVRIYYTKPTLTDAYIGRIL